MDTSNVKWVEAADNPWGVRVLDVRQVTLGLISTSKDPMCAHNAGSYGQDDGTGFAGQRPAIQRTVQTGLCFRKDRLLADGALFIPRTMEHKWAIYFHQGRILFIRSWLRTVVATAEVEQSGEEVRVTTFQGAFEGENEEPTFSVRATDFLLRTHALGIAFPAPLHPGLEDNPEQAALRCFSCFGNFAHFATPHTIPPSVPAKPLRSDSLLHISVARGDNAAVDKHLAAGVPIDLLAADGLAPLHWALAAKRRKLPLIGSWGQDTAMLNHLLQNGSPVDVRSAEGATPLMNAVQTGTVRQVKFLLDHVPTPTLSIHAASLRYTVWQRWASWISLRSCFPGGLSGKSRPRDTRHCRLPKIEDIRKLSGC